MDLLKDSSRHQEALGKMTPYHPFYLRWQRTVGQIINTAETKNLFRGFQIGHHKVMVSHLQFADDTLILAEGSERNIMVLKALITCFKLIFLVSQEIGQRVPWQLFLYLSRIFRFSQG